MQNGKPYYLRLVMLQSEQPASRKRPSSGDAPGVRFRPERKGYLATRKQNGKVTYKTFKVKDDADELERAEIVERAQRWVEGEDLSDQEKYGTAANADAESSDEDGQAQGQHDSQKVGLDEDSCPISLCSA